MNQRDYLDRYFTDTVSKIKLPNLNTDAVQRIDASCTDTYLRFRAPHSGRQLGVWFTAVGAVRYAQLLERSDPTARPNVYPVLSHIGYDTPNKHRKVARLLHDMAEHAVRLAANLTPAPAPAAPTVTAGEHILTDTATRGGFVPPVAPVVGHTQALHALDSLITLANTPIATLTKTRRSEVERFQAMVRDRIAEDKKITHDLQQNAARTAMRNIAADLRAMDIPRAVMSIENAPGVHDWVDLHNQAIKSLDKLTRQYRTV